MLTDVEREHLFLLGLGRPPEVRYRRSDRCWNRRPRPPALDHGIADIGNESYGARSSVIPFDR
jgi:hypothetical protein